MNPFILFGFILLYFILLIAIAWTRGRQSDNKSYFIGNKNNNWALVAFGLIGTSLSGITFISVPGSVLNKSFAYMQVTLGYLFGYVVIALVLLPLYYRLQLTSIYTYLHGRFGTRAHKTGAAFFMLSRVLITTARLYIVIKVLQDCILANLHIPFVVSTIIILVVILIYTFNGGIKTTITTSALQTSFMLTGLLICIIFILHSLHLNLFNSLIAMQQQGYTQIFFLNTSSTYFFPKQIVGGMLLTIAMTGIDQEMMQKVVSVKRLKDAQKNIISLGITLVVVIFLFLFLGGVLYLYGIKMGGVPQLVRTDGITHLQFLLHGKNVAGDNLFPALALGYMPQVIGIIFTIALISALFPSVDGAITSLTASYCIDIIDLEKRNDWTEKQKQRKRKKVQIAYTLLFFIILIIFRWIDNRSMIDVILRIAAYTYGPLLGLFIFGIVSKKQVRDSLVPYVCLVAPLLCLLLDGYQKSIFGSYTIGFEFLLLFNALFTIIGLLCITKYVAKSRVPFTE